MVEVGLLPKLVELLKKAPFRAKTIRLLYHLSADDATNAKLGETDLIPLVMQLIINFPQKTVAKELASLAINVSNDPGCAEQFTEHRGISQLLSRVDEYGDVLLAKVIRNISQWTFAEQVSDSRATSEASQQQPNTSCSCECECDQQHHTHTSCD